MKVIFLDIDGVLNSRESLKNRSLMFKETGNWGLEINEEMVKNLAKIVEETQSKIVLTSSWRRLFIKKDDAFVLANNEVNQLFQNYGIIVSDVTPYDTTNNRAIEILRWLNDHRNIENFIIIDDQSENLEYLSSQLIKTDIQVGLSEEDVIKAIDVLNNKSFGTRRLEQK